MSARRRPVADEVIPLRPPHAIVKTGGPPDLTSVVLALYAEDLDPDIVSRELGCAPTRAHRKGDRRGPRSPPFSTGAWLLELSGEGPIDPDVLLSDLLGRFPRDSAFWAKLRASYRVRVLVALHIERWNRGFELSPRTVAMVSATGAEFGFDLYFYAGDD